MISNNINQQEEPLDCDDTMLLTSMVPKAVRMTFEEVYMRMFELNGIRKLKKATIEDDIDPEGEYGVFMSGKEVEERYITMVKKNNETFEEEKKKLKEEIRELNVQLVTMPSPTTSKQKKKKKSNDGKGTDRLSVLEQAVADLRVESNLLRTIITDLNKVVAELRVENNLFRTRLTTIEEWKDKMQKLRTDNEAFRLIQACKNIQQYDSFLQLTNLNRIQVDEFFEYLQSLNEQRNCSIDAEKVDVKHRYYRLSRLFPKNN